MPIEGSYRDLQSISVLAAPERMFHSTSSFVESQVTCVGGIVSASQPRDEEPSGGGRRRRGKPTGGGSVNSPRRMGSRTKTV